MTDLPHPPRMAARKDGAPGKAARHAAILSALARDPTVRISALAASFGVSAETVRRDVEALSASGAVRRTYGGASVTHAGVQPALSTREGMRVAERARIGALAAAMIEDGAVVMVDGGSTTAAFARALAARRVRATLITNSLLVATAAGEGSRLRVVLAPGDLDPVERATGGVETGDFLRRFNADLAVIGASGLTEDGPCDAESRAAAVKRAMLERAAGSLLVVDRGKFGRRYLERVAPLAALSGLITDGAPAAPLTAALDRAGVVLHVTPDV